MYYYYFKDDSERKSKYEELDSYYSNKSAFLIGNGINLLSEGRTWEHLLRNISEEFQIDVRITKDKSFPLIFEELLFRSDRDFQETLNSFKRQIFEELEGTPNTDYHGKILKLNCKEYLTTNYDYGFEKVHDSNFNSSQVNSRETKYSLFRRNELNEKKIWHIHGELDHGLNTNSIHQSIMIGNEHYGDYYQKIHEFLKPPGAILKALKNERDSWTKKFFTHDLHIMGLSFDYSEAHLWWILNYRARLEQEFGEIPNQIYYHYPSFNYESNRSKLELLTALGVTVKPTVIQNEGDDQYLRFWDVLINQTLENLDIR